MSVPTAVVREQEWNSKREALLVKEKELTHARDALAAERRRLPMVRIESDYRFEGPGGEVGLLGLFEGRRQLIVYPQDPTGSWVSRHDEYSANELAGGRT